jgi:hypothetical protein
MKFRNFLSERLCRLCERRVAKFMSRGRIKRDRQHDICRQCYRELRDRNAAQLVPTTNSGVFSFEMSSYFYPQALKQPFPRKPGNGQAP